MKRLAVLTGFLVVAVVAAVAPPGQQTEAQQDCFAETNFCITTPQFQTYFRERGGARILGFPISRDFTLEGFRVQFFQRVILQLQGNDVARLNVLDPGIMPMTRANFSQFPGPDSSVAGAAPQVGSPEYARRVVEFVRDVSPESFNNMPVGFFTLFNTTVPITDPNPDIVTLLNLEIWGIPTSRPTPDPTNANFVYQRYQRGIMHYQGFPGSTLGILVADYFKSVLTLRNLPADLAEDMQGSRFLGQYDPTKPNWVARPAELPNTDMTAAFEPGTGAVVPPPAQATATPPPGPTQTPGATPITGPQVTASVSDPTIRVGESISVTTIARDPAGIDRIEIDGEDTDDPALETEQEFDCRGIAECGTVFVLTPTRSNSDAVLVVRAVNQNGVQSEPPLRIQLQIRRGTPTVTPTATPTATATSTPVP